MISPFDNIARIITIAQKFVYAIVMIKTPRFSFFQAFQQQYMYIRGLYFSSYVYSTPNCNFLAFFIYVN